MRPMHSSVRFILVISWVVACAQRSLPSEAQEEGDFSLSITPAELTLDTAGTANAEVHVDRSGGFTGAIAVAMGGLPEGVTAETLTIRAGATTGALTFHRRAGSPAVTARVMATASARNAAATFVFTLACPAAAPFTLAVDSPGASLQQGGSTGVHFNVTRAAGFAGALLVRAIGLPAGISAPEVTLDGAAGAGTLVLSADASAASGIFYVTLGASDGQAQATASLELDVLAPCGLHIDSFAAATSAVFVGESTQLTAVFTGDSAAIDGIGPVESGRPAGTPPLART